MSTETPEVLLVLHPHAQVEATSERAVSVIDRGRRLPIPATGTIIVDALTRLAGDGATERTLWATASETGVETEMFALALALRMLDDSGVLCRRLVADAGPVATLVPRTPKFRYTDVEIVAGQLWSLSRSCSLRVDNMALVAEAPLGDADLRLDNPEIANVVATLGRPQTLGELKTRFPDLADGTLRAFLVLLKNAGLLAGYDDGSAPWEHHDLWFHTRSRRGLHQAPYGGTGRGRKPLPLVKPARGDREPISLLVPAAERLHHTDPSLHEVMERRRSVREHAEDPMTIEQLGEFLWRTARYQLIVPGAETDVALRPTPSGGALQELEVYPVVVSCRGLDPGVYHYRPAEHTLEWVADPSLATERLVAEARSTADGAPPLQVYLQITARCGRVFWKYESMAYALILKNLGAMYAMMYLVATAMHLAPCALGGGDSELFAAASGVDARSEPAVGEFILGTCRAS